MISGHQDKNLRMWDLRAEEPLSKVELGGAITSLALSRDGNALLVCTRADALALLDLRTNAVLHHYAGESFRVPGSDAARAALSPDAAYAAAGSHDGSVFVWNVDSSKVETVLSRGGHQYPSSSSSAALMWSCNWYRAAVMAVAWHPSGCGLLSADRHKTICFWS